MAEKAKTFRLPFVLNMAGAMIAYYIGASTGTGQEFFQSYSSHGIMGAVGAVIQQVLLAVLALVVIRICQKHHLAGAKECFIWFLGKYVGTAIYYYTVAFIFCTLVQLISGTGSIVTQYFGTPYYVGALILTALLIASVLCGFKRLIEIISKIAPLILVVMIITAAISLINPTDGLIEGSKIAVASQEVYRTADTWWGSTILHHTYLILFLVPYYVSCYTVDQNATKRETVSWIIIAYSILAVLCLLMILSHVANISLCIGSQAPNVSIAMVHSPKLAALLVAMIMAASYTTTAPIALIAAEYFAKPDTTRYKVVGIVIILVGLIVSFAGSYAQIINVLVSVSGRIGVAIYILAAIYRIYRMFREKKTAA